MSEPEERRSHPRYDLPFVVRTDEGEGRDERLVDMSRSGCGLASPVYFSQNEHFLLHFDTPRSAASNHGRFCLHGLIVWRRQVDRNQYRYGVRFPERTSPFFEEMKELADRVMDELISSFSVSPQTQHSIPQPG